MKPAPVQNGPGDTAVITIHIQGTDDAPVLLADTSSLALHQDEAHAWNSTTAAGTFAIVDLDKGDATQLKITDVSANEQGEWKVRQVRRLCYNQIRKWHTGNVQL